MKTHDISGDVLHVLDKKTPNKFLIMGEQHTNGVRQPGESIRRFRLVEEDRVDELVESLALERVAQAVMKWKDEERTGVLWLRLKPAQNATQAQSDARNGGGERLLKVKDLLHDLTKDNDLVQSRTRPAVSPSRPSPLPGWGEDDWGIPPRQPPKVKEEEPAPEPPKKVTPQHEMEP